MKLCVGASSGGHMAELNALLGQAWRWPVQPSVHVSTVPTLGSPEDAGVRYYATGECNRHTPFAALRVLGRAVAIVARERPSVVISTGSLPLALFCLVARLAGAKIIWIDSISQIDRISMSGRFAKRFASVFMVQWPDLARTIPGARYEGELI